MKTYIILSTKSQLTRIFAIYIHIYINYLLNSLTNRLIFYVLTLTALPCPGAEPTSFLGLDNSIDGSDDLLEPLVDGETNPVLLGYQTQNLTNPLAIAI